MTELGDKNNGIKAKSKPSVCSDILRTPTNDCPAVNKTWTEIERSSQLRNTTETSSC